MEIPQRKTYCPCSVRELLATARTANNKKGRWRAISVTVASGLSTTQGKCGSMTGIHSRSTPHSQGC